MNYLYLFLGFYLSILLFKVFFTIKKKKIDVINPLENIDLSQITIVQPILSGDPTLESNLIYNLQANPEIKFLWLIDNNDLFAQELTKSLKNDFKDNHIEILSYIDCPAKINPKVFKLNQGLKKVFTDYVIILDDDAFLPSDTLNDLIINLKKNDLTTALPIYLDNGNFWCKLMAQFVNNNSAMTYLPLLHFFKPVSINGMCYAMRLTTIQKLNYLEGILNFLADDLSLALFMKEKKMDLYQSRKNVILQTNIDNSDRYMALMHRWFLFAKLLWKKQSLKEKSIIALLYALPPVLLWFIVLYSVRDLHFIILPLFLIIRFLLIKWVHKAVFNKNDLHDPGISILSELMQPVHLFEAIAIKTIMWRSHIYRVESNEDFREI